MMKREIPDFLLGRMVEHDGPIVKFKKRKTFTRLKFHYPGGQDHDQSTHGNWAKGGPSGRWEDVLGGEPEKHAEGEIRQIASGVYTVDGGVPSDAAYRNIDLPMNAIEYLADFEAEATKLPVENFIGFDADTGEPVVELSGSSNSITFGEQTKSQLANLTGKLIYTHNHPGEDNNSFSPADVNTGRYYNAREIRCVTRDGIVFRMWPGPDGWPDPMLLSSITYGIGKDMWNDVDRKIRSVSNDPKGARLAEQITEQANAMHYHELWTRVAKQIPEHIWYKRILPGSKRSKAKTWDELIKSKG
jgi:hypothetical protein